MTSRLEELLQRFFESGERVALERQRSSAYRLTCASARRLLQASGACVALLREEDEVDYVLVEGPAQAWAGARHPLASSAPGRALTAGRPTWFGGADPDAPPELSAQLPGGCALFVPFGGALPGALGVYWTEDQPRQPAAARALTTLGESLSEALVAEPSSADLDDALDDYAKLCATLELESFDLDRALQRYELAGRLASAGTWEWNLVTQEVFWSEETYRCWGYEVGEFEGKFEAVAQRVHPEDRAAWREDIRRCVEGGHEHRLDFRVIWPDGSVRWVSALGNLDVDALGQPVMSGLVLDMTERKRSEQALRESEELYRTLYEASPAGLFLTPPYEFKNPNSRALELFGATTADELERLGPVELSPERQPDGTLSAPKAAHYVERAMAGEPQVFEWRHKRVDGSEWDAEVRLARIDAFDQALLLGTLVDISQRKRAEAAQAELQARLHHMDKLNAIGQLAGGVAHDFNNQLAGILGYAELISSETELSAIHRFAERILRSSQRAASLTKQLLTFGRRERTVSRPVDVHALIHEVFAILQRGVVEKRITLRAELEAGHAVTTGDASQLQNALLNLGLNARDAMPGGGELCARTQDLTLAPAEASALDLEPGPYLRVELSDTGVGMPPEIQRRIFEPFFTTKPAGAGSGMGLASVFGAIQAHGGAIGVESEPGRGTTFRIYLPLEPDLQPPRSDRMERQPSARAGARVLAVDDEPLVLAMVESLLRSLGHEVTPVGDPDEALRIFAADPASFDLAVLDMVMPKRTGRELFNELREISPDLPAILVTGFSETSDTEQALEAGVSSIVSKPFRRADLVAALELALGSRSS